MVKQDLITKINKNSNMLSCTYSLLAHIFRNINWYGSMFVDSDMI